MPEFRRVPSYPQLTVTDEGEVIGPSGRQLKHFPGKSGYRRITLYIGEGRWKQFGVHSLVCEAFHGTRPSDKHLVAHGDGNPSNNRAENLRWATYEENEADKRAHGRSLLGERHHQAVLTEAAVRQIRYRRAAGESGARLAREFGVTPSQICAIHRRRSWRHI